MAPPTTSTAKLGLVLPTTGNPDYEPGNGLAQVATALSTLEATLLGRALYTAAGAIAKAHGTVILKAGSAAAMTLAAPIVGTEDGLTLKIIAVDAFAYTVTTPASKINGSLHIATWTAAIGNSIELIAENGVWYNVGTPLGVALT